MKVAFVHDWFTIPAGAEKVAAEIIDLIQPERVYSLFNFMPFGELNRITQGRGVKTSFLQQVPAASEHYRHLAPLYPKAISKLDVSEFDIIISSSWMAAKGVNKREGQIHISYCHTPMRFAWGLQETYLKKYGYNHGIKKWLAKLMINRLKNWDEQTAEGVDHFVANSNFVSQRIDKAYGRQSTVIYPPIQCERFALHEDKADFYFTASRFVDYKNLELIIDTFSRLPNHKLVIAGQGPLEKHLKRMATPNVSFLGWVSDESLVYHMQRAKAFLNASIEDFGIAGLEAQSCGTPVIALGKGGYTETVVDQETGIFFEREHPEALADAILRFEKLEFDPEVVRQNALRYDKESFREQFLNLFLDKCFISESSLA
ncbi:MAG: glycosyltransferase [Flavobacteriales bacterium]|jgi:glycosyltransferase involved in cell wall biosynthesis|nr:glycosyltransferase [Flavobacteriales bacterium]MBT3964046.1 glycosyltransferase [Flavobacteriales bacterium]MBT4704737.1 glycosyltransferase [Flavobacteriales bacterium]MBT4931680.1 glycosyltransferase [Flavobacteriales bacterium]MBT5133646.1 glycosyltransferase [Flavobacteriales bacterium]